MVGWKVQGDERIGGLWKSDKVKVNMPRGRDRGHCNRVFTSSLVHRKTLNIEMTCLALPFRTLGPVRKMVPCGKPRGSG